MSGITADEIRETIAQHSGSIGGPISALRAVVALRGYITPDDEGAVAEIFNLSRADVRGIVSFYADLRTTPPARNTIAICRAEACQSVSGRELTSTLTQKLGVGVGGRAADGSVELVPVYCLGLCANGPAVRVNGRLIARSHERMDEILEVLQ